MSSAQAFSHVEWDPERFGIGIRQIDDQHKQLIAIVNDLAALVQEAHNANALRRLARSRLNQTSAQCPTVSASHSPTMGGESMSMASPRPYAAGLSTSRNHHLGGSASPPAGGRSIHGSPQGPAGAALRGASAIGSPHGSPSLFSARSPSAGTGGGGPSVVVSPPTALSAVAPLSIPNAFQLAQGRPDLYTPASHLRAFPACYQRPSAVWECLGRLVTYCLRSLAAEDHILETYGYADRATQMQEHEAFGEQVCRYHRLSEECALEEEDLLHLLVFLKLWVREHIPRDRRYAPLLLEKGIGV